MRKTEDSKRAIKFEMINDTELLSVAPDTEYVLQTQELLSRSSRNALYEVGYFKIFHLTGEPIF